MKILKNEQVAPHAYKMTLLAPEIAKKAKPGQFVMVRAIDGYQPLLRRPLGIHRIIGQNIVMLYEIVGEGTKFLSQKKAGETLDIIGPLGNGFDLRATILIAGGMGVAPLIFLAEKLKKQKPLILLGAKTKTHILCEKEFKALGCDVKVATDDGSKGYKGFVTGLLKATLCHPERSEGSNKRCVVYACGPKPMLKAVAVIAKQHNISAQVSLEEYMACGIGACLGCIVKTKSGQKRVCKDGPVFNAREVIWE